MQKGLDAWNHHWSFENKGGIYLQASESPIWDTLLTLQGLLDCGENFKTFPQMGAALDWVLEKQIFIKGDWAVSVKDVECGGWALSAQIPTIPISMIQPSLSSCWRAFRKEAPTEFHARIDHAIARADAWVRAMQSSNGGWAAFDKDNNTWILTQIPFCDFGEGARSAERGPHRAQARGVGFLGHTMSDPAVRRAVDYVMSEQEPEGSWFGRWGVNHLYGTALVLPGLKAVGFDATDPRITQKRAMDRIQAAAVRRVGRVVRVLHGRQPPRPRQRRLHRKTAWAL